MGEKEACPDKTVIIGIPEDLEPDLDNTCWIQRVPRKLRLVNKEAYTPKLVSIGPFHHGKQELKAMEHHKAKYYDKFWERDFCKHIKENDIEDFISKGDRRQRIRNSYAGTFDQPLNDEDHFFKVILRDSCFIFELFLRNLEYRLHAYESSNKTAKIADYILGTTWLKKAIELDLLMVENQLPFFVFTELFDFILKNQPENLKILPLNYPSKKQHKESDDREDFITTITCEFFADYYLNGKAIVQQEQVILTVLTFIEPAEEMERFKEIKHFTDLVRQFLLPADNFGDNIKTRCCYSAKELDSAGVNFSGCNSKFLADIQREKGKFISWNSLTLKIPQFKVEDNTEFLMKNVMALEQCLYEDKAHICSYITLLDQLIDTVEDVDFLVKNKVVENWLGSNKEVAKLINKLRDEIVETSFYYGDICKQLNDHYESPWNVAKATLKRVYFKDIWTGSSTVVAVVFLIFSIFSVISTIKNLFF